MSQKEKRQFVTIPITRGSSRTGEPEVTLAVDEIKSISDLRSTVPVFEEGARADVLLKGKEGQGYHATISREEILARIEAPVQKPAILRFRLKPGRDGAPLGYAWFDIVAIIPEAGHYNKYVLRTPEGIQWHVEPDVREAIEGNDDGECDYEEI